MSAAVRDMLARSDRTRLSERRTRARTQDAISARGARLSAASRSGAPDPRRRSGARSDPSYRLGLAAQREEELAVARRPEQRGRQHAVDPEAERDARGAAARSGPRCAGRRRGPPRPFRPGPCRPRTAASRAPRCGGPDRGAPPPPAGSSRSEMNDASMVTRSIASGNRSRARRTDVGALAAHDPRVVPELPRELAVADVDGIDPARARAAGGNR